ncbi:MAG TPA: FtsX-like permease family protein, partial [Gemmatimonadaceae bacterium]
IELRSRWRELATRSALGARRTRIIRELSFEGVGLAIAALFAGTWLAMVSLAALRAVGVQAVPQLADARIDLRVIVVASAVAITTSIVIAMLSGWVATQRAPAGYLTTAGASQRRAKEGTFAARLIVGVQFSLASFLVIGALLLSVNLRRLSTVDAGFDPTGRFVAAIEVGSDANDPATAIPIFSNIADRVRRLPRVRDVAIASAIPFSGGNSNGAMTVEHSGRADTVSARFSSMLPGFLETLGLRVIAGRSIDDSDRTGNEPVAVVNETTAKRFFPLGSVGGHVVVGDTRFTVVGVVSDVHHTSLVDSTMATVYFAERQKHSRFLQLLIRTNCADASSRRCADMVSLAMLRAAVADVALGAVVVAVESMPTLVQRTFAGDRFRAAMIGMFAAVAILITVFGAYTTTARAIQLARADIAIRLALGATNAATIGRFSSDIGIVAAVGTLVGSLGAMYAGKFVTPFLSLTSASEPVVYLTVLLGLPAIALATAVLASGAITRISPVSVLKSA